MPLNSAFEITVQYVLRKESNLIIVFFFFLFKAKGIEEKISLPKKEDSKKLKESPKFVVAPSLKEATQQNSHKLSKKSKTGEN